MEETSAAIVSIVTIDAHREMVFVYVGPTTGARRR